MQHLVRSRNTRKLRVIHTARDITSINKAVENGFRPLIKKVAPSPEIFSKYCVVRNKRTGAFEVLSDFREDPGNDPESLYETVIDWTSFYPYHFRSPFAAYLIPPDIQPGERVFIKDLIEDYIGAHWGQGDNYRLQNCEAIWNGTDLEIQYDPHVNRTEFIG